MAPHDHCGSTDVDPELPFEDEDDPVLLAFLAFLDESMCDHPELLKPLTVADIAGLDELLEGIEVDLDAPLGDNDYCLP